MKAKAQRDTVAAKMQLRDGWPILALALTMVATPAHALIVISGGGGPTTTGPTPASPPAPTGVTPGSSYRLMFITSGTTDATSTSIGDYNSFVTTQAALNPLLATTSWAAIGSTATTSAIANTDGGSTTGAAYTSDPIYMVNGSEVTTSLENFFASAALFNPANPTNPLIINPLTLDENGNNADGGYIWTGSNTNGTAASGAELGSSNPDTWMLNLDGSPGDNGDWRNAMGFPMIAISAPILAPSPVPDPASGGLLAAGVGMLGLLGWRRRRAA